MTDQYKAFIYEAETFFVSKFLTSQSIEEMFTRCLDNLFDKNERRGVIAFNKKYGQSKSFFFEVVNHRFRRFYGRNFYKMTSAKELTKIFKQHGEQTLLEYISVRNLFIDDIGDESEDGSYTFIHFSNRMNVLKYVLNKRYEWWLSKEYKTYGTTNLTQENIAINYDGRIADRLTQMTIWETFDFLKTGSFRNQKTTRPLTMIEVSNNWDAIKTMTPAVDQPKIDITVYLNEMLSENDLFLSKQDISSWGFIKDALVDLKHLSDQDFQSISDANLAQAEALIKESNREYINVVFKHAIKDVKNNEKKKRDKSITSALIRKVAESLVAKRKFLELRSQTNFKF